MHVACPFDFDLCKKIAADGMFKEDLVRVSARKKKETAEKLVKQGQSPILK